MGEKEREIVRVFLADLYHSRDIKRRMREVSERFSKEQLFAIVETLRGNGILDEEESKYLKDTISELHRRLP